MADPSSSLPLTRESVRVAHDRIKPFIHHTPVLTSTTISGLASERIEAGQDAKAAKPNIRLFFKCENYQKVGAFKARGAYHALSRLTEEQLEKGVITHSSGNHAQALALAARTRGIKAYIVMPTISTPSKIAGTRSYGAEVIFSGSTSEEREAVVDEVQERTGALLVPPYDHPDIILGQGTMALELEEQVKDLLNTENHLGNPDVKSDRLDAVIAPCGGGGMLSGVATALFGTGTYVFGAEPSFEGADDARRGLAQGRRIESVKTLTIADGLRTPVGVWPWSVISDPTKVKAVFSVTESQIKAAMRLVLERMKVVIEPSSAVPLAVVLFCEDFRRLVEAEAGADGWNVGVIFSGGNTTVEAIGKLFEDNDVDVGERAAGLSGLDGSTVAENVAG